MITNAQTACLHRLYLQDTNRVERPYGVRRRTMKALYREGYLIIEQEVGLTLTQKALDLARECHWRR